MTEQTADPVGQLSDEAVERRIAGLSAAAFQALVARARPTDPSGQPAVPPAPLTPYEIAQAQNARKRDGFRAKVDQLANIPTGRNGAVNGMSADSGTQPEVVNLTTSSQAGAPEPPEAAAPVPHQPRPSLTPLGFSPTSRPPSGPRSMAGLSRVSPGLKLK
jgi:hypothetical protein